jgi:hypothetical protein
VPSDNLDRLAGLLLPVLHDEQQRRRVIGRLRPVLQGRPRARPRLRVPSTSPPRGLLSVGPSGPVAREHPDRRGPGALLLALLDALVERLALSFPVGGCCHRRPCPSTGWRTPCRLVLSLEVELLLLPLSLPLEVEMEEELLALAGSP